MVDLFRLAVAKPLQAILAGVVIVTIAMSARLIELEMAMAVVKEQQSSSISYEQKFDGVRDTVIRIDTNLEVMMNQLGINKQQEKFKNHEN